MPIKDFFYDNKADRRAIFALLFIAVVALVAVFLLDTEQTTTEASYAPSSQNHGYKGRHAKETTYYNDVLSVLFSTPTPPTPQPFCA